MTINEINIRDPYVMVYDKKYYLYGTRSDTCWGEAFGFDCYVSNDIVNFEGPFEIFNRPDDFFATENFWAPECYAYKDKFYLLTTFGGKEIKKGLYILESDSPLGPFKLYSERLTPDDWTCIDGTLYFEKEKVYMIYSHSFEDDSNADICYQELSATLERCITEPETLFAAKEALWAKPVPFAEQEFGLKGDVYFSDGPCLFRAEDGNLCMTWSSWSKGSYAVGVAVSLSGSVGGPWRQIEKPLWKENGGHGMIFRSVDNKSYFCLHYPNDKGKEHPLFCELEQNKADQISLKR